MEPHGNLGFSTVSLGPLLVNRQHSSVCNYATLFLTVLGCELELNKAQFATTHTSCRMLKSLLLELLFRNLEQAVIKSNTNVVVAFARNVS